MKPGTRKRRKHASRLSKGLGARCARLFRNTARRWKQPVRGTDISQAMAACSPSPPEILMMHSSLSGCGYLIGGAATLIDAVEDHCSTLVLPTHTYCYPANSREAPVFDPRQTPSRVGAVSDCFWRLPGVRRSVHPTHSLAARGPVAEEICADHIHCDTPCGSSTPYDKLIEKDAAALMFGCTMHSYTFFHTAEDAAEAPYAYEPNRCTMRHRDDEGMVQSISVYRHTAAGVARRFAAMGPVLEEAGLLKRLPLVAGELLYVPSSQRVHEFIVGRLNQHADFLLASFQSESMEAVGL